MKVEIGPYKNWIGPYQITDLLQKVGVSEDRCDEFGDWLADTPLTTFCDWIDSKKKRKIQVRIDKYDTWSMDSTLAYIILPMLKHLKETKHGSPVVNDKDVPKELRSTSAPAKENESDTDDNWHDRWDWILGEMVWAFSQINDEWDDQCTPRQRRFETMPDHQRPGLIRIDKRSHKPRWRHLSRKHNGRIKNGFRLFGKYYQHLWD